MIQQQMKVHPEPTPYVYVAPTTTTTPPAAANNVAALFKQGGAVNLFTQNEVNKAHSDCIIAGVRIGNRYRMKHGTVTIEIIGYMLNAPYVESIDGEPAVLRGKRISMMDQKEFEFAYSLSEIKEMEKV